MGVSATKTDPLLVSARVLTVIIQLVLIVSLVAVGISIAALTAMGPTGLWTRLAVPAAPSEAYAALMVSLVIVGAIVATAARFFAALHLIIQSVDQGQPFERENASRLRRMGWQSAIVQGLILLLALISKYVDPYFGRSLKGAGIDLGVDPATLLLILVLFILARVFERGAVIEDDLEGTV